MQPTAWPSKRANLYSMEGIFKIETVYSGIDW